MILIENRWVKKEENEMKQIKQQIQTIMNTLGEIITNQNDKDKLANGLICNAPS